MKILKVPGSLIPPIDEGEEELDCNAFEWGVIKGKCLMSGKDTARSRGGKVVIRTD